jgi:deoxycytidine triphosphate deaminase
MAVLGDKGISEKFEEVFKEGTASRDQIRAAKYYLRLGDRHLILPDGKRYFGEEDDGPARCRPFALKPGETTLVTTKEKLAMPPNLSGIVGPVFDLTDNGILFFGGMLIDPGFGMRRKDDTEWEKEYEPLSFYLANVGSEPIQLRPGRDKVASIAFLQVSEAHEFEKFPKSFETTSARLAREELFDPRRQDAPDRALGLVEDISDIRHRVEKFEASTQQVVLFGVIVLAITLFTAIVTLTVNDPSTAKVSSLELGDVTKTVGLAVVEITVLVIVFYIAVSAFVRLRDRPRKRPRAG